MDKETYLKRVEENRLKKFLRLKTIEKYLEDNKKPDWELQEKMDYKHTDYFFLMSRYTVDPNSQERLAQKMCRSCYYFANKKEDRILRDNACALCGNVHLYPVQDPPLLCAPCAVERCVCQLCGDIRD